MLWDRNVHCFLSDVRAAVGPEILQAGAVKGLRHRQHDANFQGNPLFQATKRHLNDSETVKNSEK